MLRTTNTLISYALKGALLISMYCLPYAAAQQPFTRGIYNWVHTTGDMEAAFDFYRDTFDIELAPSPFYGDPDAPPQRLRSVEEAGSDALVWDLTNTAGSRYRSAFLKAANTQFGLELVEFFDIPRSTRAPNPWDPGASILVFSVRDLDTIVARLQARSAPILTPGGAPIDTSTGRAILARNPDGYLFQIMQTTTEELAAASPGEVIETAIHITIADMSAALEFYGDLLGLEVGQTRRARGADLRLYGLQEGALLQTEMIVPGTGARILLSAFTLPESESRDTMGFDWKIQDVNAPQFQLEVANLDELLVRTRASGYRFLSVGERPIDRPFGRFVFVKDPDGVLVEYVEPVSGQ